MSIQSRAVCSRARRLLRLVACMAAAAAVFVTAQPRASAEAERISCTFLEIQASNKGDGIDPKLSQLSKKLERPPLSSWKSFKLVDKHDMTLERMKPARISLKLSGKLETLYQEHTKPEGKKDRFSLSLAVDDKGGKRALDTKISLRAGSYWVLAVTSSSESGDLLALTCNLP